VGLFPPMFVSSPMSARRAARPMASRTTWRHSAAPGGFEAWFLNRALRTV